MGDSDDGFDRGGWGGQPLKKWTKTHLASLVLRHLVLGVLLALLALAVGASRLRDVDLFRVKEWHAVRMWSSRRSWWWDSMRLCLFEIRAERWGFGP